MSEYDQLCKLLDRRFQASKQNLMIEAKGTTYKPQQVEIDGTGRRNLVWTLYRFDLEEKEFLPFFNKTDDAPEGLRKFCDYILLSLAYNWHMEITKEGKWHGRKFYTYLLMQIR